MKQCSLFEKEEREKRFEYVNVDGVKVPIIGEIDSKTEIIKFYE